MDFAATSGNLGVGKGVRSYYGAELNIPPLGSLTTGSHNIALGDRSNSHIIKGSYNFTFGQDSMHHTGDYSTSDSNVAIGYGCLGGYTTEDETYVLPRARYNVALGQKAMGFQVTGAWDADYNHSYHVAIGYETLLLQGACQFNTATGFRAGYLNSFMINNGGGTIEESYNTYVGLLADV